MSAQKDCSKDRSSQGTRIQASDQIFKDHRSSGFPTGWRSLWIATTYILPTIKGTVYVRPIQMISQVHGTFTYCACGSQSHTHPTHLQAEQKPQGIQPVCKYREKEPKKRLKTRNKQEKRLSHIKSSKGEGVNTHTPAPPTHKAPHQSRKRHMQHRKP